MSSTSRGERHIFRPNAFRRTPAPALIVVDEAECIGQSIQVGQEIAVVEIRASVKDDDWRSLTDLSGVERRCAYGYTALGRLRASSDLHRACRLNS